MNFPSCYLGYPNSFLLLFDSDSDEKALYALPEAVQQNLLKQGFHSRRAFHELLEEEKKKE